MAVKRLPSGQEVMKRKTPSDTELRPKRFESDPKKAYTPEQLAEIGAISLKWNQIEAHIDFLGSFILYNKSPFWLIITTNEVLSTNKKLSLLEESLKHAKLLDEKAKNCIHGCFSEIAQCRSYRNAILHHQIYDHEKGIGSYVDESKYSFQILVSIDALRTLYNILSSLLEELREIDLLFRMEMDAQRPGRLDTVTGKFHRFSDGDLKSTLIPEGTKRILALQAARVNLQKLPQFPDAELIRSINARDESQA